MNEQDHELLLAAIAPGKMSPHGPADYLPTDHLTQAKNLLATAQTRVSTMQQAWDTERLAAAQIHALIALVEAIRSVAAPPPIMLKMDSSWADPEVVERLRARLNRDSPLPPDLSDSLE